MTDREKLEDIVCNAMQKDYCVCHCNHPPCLPVTQIVDDLIAHGVTVKEPQKPLTVEAMKELWEKCNSETVWLEDYTGMILDVKIWTINTQEVWFEKDVNEIYAPLSTHGRKWRCWAEKPTDEERKAAEWE